MLANRLLPKYRYENCAVIALSDGGAVVGAQIAMALHCVLSLLLSEEITLPRELEAVAGVSQDGSVSYNAHFSPGELDELVGEYYQYIEQEKLTKIHDLNHMLGRGTTVDKRLLIGRNVILVSDGLSSGFAIDLALEFLKPIPTEKVIVATPVASVLAVDHLHITVDEIHCLSVVEDYISTDHYYDQRDIPPHNKIVEIVERVILNWVLRDHCERDRLGEH